MKLTAASSRTNDPVLRRMKVIIVVVAGRPPGQAARFSFWTKPD
jgi:hypothetical protein